MASTLHASPAKRFVAAGELKFAVYEWGDSSLPQLMYLHGWADMGSTFQFVADRLADRWHVIAPDLRGFGRTEYRASAYWFPDYLADLLVLLRHFSPHDPVRLVGHSMGANIAGLFAGSMPERVAAFVNIEGFGLRDTDPADAPERYRRWLEAGQMQQSWSDYASFEAFAERLRASNPGLTKARALFVAREWAVRDERGRVTPRADPNHRRPNAVLYRRAEAEACWRCVSAPTLLISGSRSRFSERPDDTAPLPFPVQRSLRIEDAGHMIHLEQPEALATAIDQFLTEYL